MTREGADSTTIGEIMTKTKKENGQAFIMQNVSGTTVTEVRQRELGEFEFYCSKCKTTHTKSAYAIAQSVMNVRLVFTCACGNKIDL